MIADIFLMNLTSLSFSNTRDSLENIRFRIRFAQRYLRRRLLVPFSSHHDITSTNRSTSISTTIMPAIPHHNLPCTWLAPTALLVSFAVGIGFGAMKHRHLCSPLSIAQPTISFLVRIALVALEDATPGLVNIHD